MEEQKRTRVEFVDLTKGVCIALVVMLHVGGIFESFDSGAMISCFCMPLYFFVSGLFFKSYEGLAAFVIQKVNKLLIPFLIFYIGSFLLMYAVSRILPGTFRLPVEWRELLLVFRDHELIRFNPPIWFLVALFSCNLLFYAVHYLRDKHLPLFFLSVILLGVAGFWLGRHRIALPLYLDIAMTAMPFYAAGFWIRRYNFFLYPHHRFDKLIPGLIVAALVAMYLTSEPVGMRTNNYAGNIIQLYLAAFAGIFAVMLLCKKMKKMPLISYLGRYSIITLGVHGPLLSFLRPVVGAHIRGEWVQSLVLFAVTIAICLVVTPVILKFMPHVAAQKDLLKTRATQ